MLGHQLTERTGLLVLYVRFDHHDGADCGQTEGDALQVLLHVRITQRAVEQEQAVTQQESEDVVLEEVEV